MTLLGRFLPAAAALLLLTSACAEGPALRGKIRGLTTTVDDAEKNGAMKCAPRELAIARSNLEFAEIDLDQGELGAAEAHLAKAEPNAQAAFNLSPPDRCTSREFVEVASEPKPPPDVDTDSDGIFDSKDQCIDEPEDKDGYLDDDGCPDPDNDGDGIADLEDYCPNTPGVRGGDHPGCPKKNSLVVVTEKEIRITQQIQFEFNKAVIRPGISFKILDEVVEVLNENPKIDLEVQGHTDNVGGDAYNMKLSQKRADAVRAYLVAKGIAPSRLVSKGYGFHQPLVPNTTAANRLLNRRVQFIRTEAQGAGGTSSSTP